MAFIKNTFGASKFGEKLKEEKTIVSLGDGLPANIQWNTTKTGLTLHDNGGLGYYATHDHVTTSYSTRIDLSPYLVNPVPYISCVYGYITLDYDVGPAIYNTSSLVSYMCYSVEDYAYASGVFDRHYLVYDHNKLLTTVGLTTAVYWSQEFMKVCPFMAPVVYENGRPYISLYTELAFSNMDTATSTSEATCSIMYTINAHFKSFFK